MADILSTIADAARVRVASSKEKISASAMMDLAYSSGKGEFSFEKVLKKEGMSFICECKKASPSKGVIAEVFPYLDIARDYEKAGASAISVLTEPQWFKGDIRYLEEIASEVSIPCLRKDFTVDEYMIYEAKARGASAVLLICSILTSREIGRYISIADELGLSALVEAHDHNEVQIALGEGARVIGVNNRNLKDFTVDPLNCLRLREYVPGSVAFVAESGVKTKEEIDRLLINKVDAVLIGESVMRASDKAAFLNELRGIS
ncbi:MAG: indole-3-glycerol phosphate synthase TrpC [Saccharofermentans sp.]|nr:indole-3-glycerol phosphate synthase TrpC [Saccharofermentans sp.]